MGIVFYLTASKLCDTDKESIIVAIKKNPPFIITEKAVWSNKTDRTTL